MSKKEIKQVGELTCSQPNISWDRLTFSAKESVYKAWFPTYGKWLDFTDCEVMFYLDSHRPNNQPKELVVGRYHAQLLKSKRSYSCNGQWLFDGILIRYVTPYYNCRHSQFSASRRFHPQIKVALCTSFIRTIAWLFAS